MTWPPRQPPRRDIGDEDLPAYNQLIDRAVKRRFPEPEKDAGYYGRLLLSPQLANHLSEMGRIFRSLGEGDGTYSHADREFVDQVLSADFKTNIVQGLHINDALSAGVRLEAIEALRNGHEEQLTADEAELADFIRRVAGGRVTAEAWTAIEARLGERGALEYAMFILFLQLTMRLMAAVGMPEMPNEDVSAMLASFKNGTRVPNDFRSRIT